ncbi:hypothetical protein, partial [Rhizobium ruizarguesonis]|uniref:hypothetical protein n=1 Tax=Rhizobium ruizarguesonis TaxID=2081791 RepID=UPI001A8CF073
RKAPLRSSAEDRSGARNQRNHKQMTGVSSSIRQGGQFFASLDTDEVTNPDRHLVRQKCGDNQKNPTDPFHSVNLRISESRQYGPKKLEDNPEVAILITWVIYLF